MLRTGVISAALLVFALPTVVAGQDPDINREIQQSQRRLEQIREERNRLQRDLGDVRNRVRDAATELANVEQRLSASRSVLAEVEFQSEATAEQVGQTTRNLVLSQEQLAISEAVLFRRLRDIYKMGAMHTVQVLLGARSFTDLLNRYRYLQRIAAFDRSLVERVRSLEAELMEQNEALRDRMALLGSLRQDRLTEVAQLRSVEREHQSAIQQYRAREETASSRIEELDADESRMTALIDALEERRRELANRPGATLSAEDAGSLDWPLDGELIYEFGRDQRPNGTVIRWNGIGIAARTGTPVQAVKAGVVAYAGPFEGYGPTVMLSHGDGFYTLYLYLEDIGVVEGREVVAGQVVGTVGGTDTPEGPHLEFQIRAPLDGTSPQAQDPLLWLRRR
ncbi:MAG: peptidoglycan DD-metalloendopeptidase family protein [Gemmatimonadota bacterium]|nr:peptidoglycan DD-metalloendopeptidase family protein [Gemmatimonadota bacterium]MDE3004796.1 peptidoglycan DD-metalloendopeptidase family protein [Gemmatimonadota bacterium]MDE3014473.1 peptidoglycan DD-metalloendopeptidase family protein [Gemmatimonadota bacterium]